MTWLFVKRLRPFVLLACAASFALNLTLLVPSIYMVQVFDRVFSSRSEETLLMLSLFALTALGLSYFLDTARAGILAWAGRSLAHLLAPLALRQSFAQTDKPADRTDALRDIAALRGFLASNGILALFDAPWLPIYLFVIALMHPLLAVVAGAGAVTLIALGVMNERLTRPHAQAATNRARAAQKHAEALARNAEVIVGMGMSDAAVRNWEPLHAATLESQAQLHLASTRLSALARVSRQVLQIAMLGTGAWLVIDERSSPGIMIAATVLLSRALQPVEQLISGWKAMLDARGAWHRLHQRAQHDERPSLQLPAALGQIDVERLIYGFAPGRPPLIKGIGFTIRPGESVGIIGPSASGKTTLIRLILGIVQPQAGVVRLDGADISQWNRSDLGRHIGYLPQDVELFGGTVAANIARLGQLDSERIVAAAKLAHAHEMILRLPDGYETDMGIAGSTLSGGQRQRIALARALYGDPKLVVLDEPNANLDVEGDAALSRALIALKARGVTIIVVGHRSGLMAQLDKIALLRDGMLEAFDTTEKVLPQLRSIQKPQIRLTSANTEARA